MEYQYSFLAWPAAFAAILWVIDFLHIGRRGQIYIPKASSAKSSSLRLLLLLIGLVGWYFLSVAMMGPRKASHKVESPIEVNDIYFVLDTSDSMSANDFYPNRLEVAKKAVLNFIKLTPIDRMGVILFSEKAFTLVPLTRDGSIITKHISEYMSSGFLGSGTSIGDTLTLGITRLSLSPAKTKILILLTDGVSNTGTLTPEQAAEEAKTKKIKIYTIGIGSNKNAMMRGVGGAYQPIPGSSYDLALLQYISKETGAKNYTATDATSLRRVFDEIGLQARTKVKVTSQIIYEELFHQFLLKGLLILALVELSRRILFKEAVV